MANTLECHSKGDRRFSPFFCVVKAFGKNDSIENHYQRAKVFEGHPVIRNWRDVKLLQKQGLRQIEWAIGGRTFPVKSNASGTSFDIEDYGVQWYVALWDKYLRSRPDLLADLKKYDGFRDPFSRDFPMPQSKILEICSRDGVGGLRCFWRPLFTELCNLLSDRTFGLTTTDPTADNRAGLASPLHGSEAPSAKDAMAHF